MKNMALAVALVAGLLAPMALAADNTNTTANPSGGMGCCKSCCCMK